jgi:hypothetical protein
MKAQALSLDGPGLEPYVALILGDYSPAEYAERVRTDGMMPSADYYRPMIGAGRLFRAAASLDNPADAEASLVLMRKGKQALREAVLAMLDRRACPCCIALKAKLEACRP